MVSESAFVRVLLGAVSLCVILLDVHADLPVGSKKCGEHTCGKDNFCSAFDNHCRPCSPICEPNSQNYQSELCQSECQEYIHDRLYVKKNDEPTNDMSGMITQLKTMVAVTLVISCLLFVIVVCLLLFIFMRHKRMKGSFFKHFSKENGRVAAKNNNADVENPTILYKGDGLKLDMPPQIPNAPSVSPTQDPVTPATTSTPLSRPRHPSEDTTLEYAYDNPALTPSPVFNKDQPDVPGRRESSF